MSSTQTHQSMNKAILHREATTREARGTVSRRSFLQVAVIGGMALTQEAWSADKPSQPSPKEPPMNSRLFTFVAGDAGRWKIVESKSIIGEGLSSAQKLNIVSGAVPATPD